MECKIFGIALIVSFLFFLFFVKRRREKISDHPLIKKMNREKCPFYGLYRVDNVMIDQSGNQCALKAGYVPCFMEVSGMDPDFMNCPIFYSNEGRRTLLRAYERANVRVFAEEFRPPDKKLAKTWNGVPFHIWKDYIMEGEEE